MRNSPFLITAVFILGFTSCDKQGRNVPHPVPPVPPVKNLSLENTSWISNDRETVMTFYANNVFYKRTNETVPYTLSHDTLYLPSYLYPNFTVREFGDSLLLFGFKDPKKPTLRYSRL